MANLEDTLHNLNTYHTLAQVLSQLSQDDRDYQLILATGDIAHRPNLAVYQHFYQWLTAYQLPLHWLPGNHDDAKLMQQVKKIKAMPGVAKTDLLKSVLIANWQLILLDSTVPGQVAGQLNQQQLSILNKQLAIHPQRFALIALHHQPVTIGTPWLDTIGLINASELFQVIDCNPQVKGIIWGHVHQGFDKQRQGVRLLAAPSTCFQFKPGSPTFALDDDCQPGYRWLELATDGNIATGICRVTQ
jgi:Icc protein